MRIPARIRYATRILVELGKNPGQPISLPEVEKKQLISAKFAKQLLQPLEATGIVGSRRGAAGGYFLTRKPSQIKLLDVFEALGEVSRLAPCLENPGICRRTEVCGATVKWAELQGIIGRFLGKTTIQDLIDLEKR